MGRGNCWVGRLGKREMILLPIEIHGIVNSTWETLATAYSHDQVVDILSQREKDS